MGKMRYTPDRIMNLEPDEVFVFGSNSAGIHSGGAARLAYEKFGAEWGKGDGLYGQSYAIPTMQGGVETIKPYVNRFIGYAAMEWEKVFLVTKIGCGIAGFTEEEIAPLFAKAVYYDNIILPESFVRIIHSMPPSMPAAVKDMIYGQARTIIDILKGMDAQEHISSWDSAEDRLDEFFSNHLRDDGTGFNSMRAVWCIISRFNERKEEFDIDTFEKELTGFFDNDGRIWNDIESVYSRYCISKIIRYASFLDTFRRYKSYEDLRDDLNRTVVVSACGENPGTYFFSMAFRSLSLMFCVFRNNARIFEGGRFHPEEMEKAVLTDPKQRIENKGVESYIRENYAFVGCHTDLMAPKDWTVWGPVYRILDDGQIEPLCNGDDRIQGFSTAFETRMAEPILEEDENYRAVDLNGRSKVFVPVSDYTRPVIHSRNGIVPFRSAEEKKQYIDRLLNVDRR